MRTANPRQDPNSGIYYDVIWRHTAAHLQEDDTQPCSKKQDLNYPTGVHPIYLHHTLHSSSTSIYRRKTPSHVTNRIWTPQPVSTRATRNTYLTHPYIIRLYR